MINAYQDSARNKTSKLRGKVKIAQMFAIFVCLLLILTLAIIYTYLSIKLTSLMKLFNHDHNAAH